MHGISKDIRPLVSAIKTILDEHPIEDDAAPKLRALAIKHRVRRSRVFAAYRLLKQQQEPER